MDDMYSGRWDDYECTCSQCGAPGQGEHCDVELANPCSGCICDSCASHFDVEWRVELERQRDLARECLKTADPQDNFPSRGKFYVSVDESLCGKAAFLPKLVKDEHGNIRFAFETRSREDYERAKKCTEEADMQSTLSPSYYYYDVETDRNGEIDATWCAGNLLTTPPANNWTFYAVKKTDRAKALGDFLSVHSNSLKTNPKWKKMYDTYFREGKLTRYDYIQLIAGRVKHPVNSTRPMQSIHDLGPDLTSRIHKRQREEEEAAAKRKPRKKKKVAAKPPASELAEPQVSLQVGKAYQRGAFMHIVQHIEGDRVWCLQVRIEEDNKEKGRWVHNIAGGCTVIMPLDALDPKKIMRPSQPQMVNIRSAIGVSNTQQAIAWIVSQGKEEILISSEYPYRVIKPEQPAPKPKPEATGFDFENHTFDGEPFHFSG